MFRRIWQTFFGPRTQTTIILPNFDRQDRDQGTSNQESESTGLEDASVELLTEICDNYWDRSHNTSPSSVEEALSPASIQEYNQYISAVNELGCRGPEILAWTVERLQHPNYDAREQAAWLMGELTNRQLIDENREQAIEELCKLATRPIEEDQKEAQANYVAISALGEIGDERAIPALRHVLTDEQWDDDELQWEAAQVLEKLTGESFMSAEKPVAAAKAWLKHHPPNAG